MYRKKFKANYWVLLLAVLLVSCDRISRISNGNQVLAPCDPKTIGVPSNQDSTAGMQANFPTINGALLASRFATLEDLKKAITIQYSWDSSNFKSDSSVYHRVVLAQCDQGKQAISILETGVSQKEFVEAKNGDFWDRLSLGRRNPYAVAHRRELQRIYLLARRKPEIFGEGSVAFFDLALSSVDNISTPELAFLTERDSSEKGYLNSFNHITAQAFITTLYSEKMADFVADLHERHTMPELMTGVFTEEQLSDLNRNPVDNYVDMINNEWGQELGLLLRQKYSIGPETVWTPQLLADYLNDIQHYYGWAFQIGFTPFRPDDEVVVRFTEKLARVLTERPSKRL